MNAIISSEEVLSIVKQMLRLSHTTDQDVYLDALILEGARRLSTNETLIIRNKTVTIQDSKFYLPDDCKTLLAFRYSNSCVPGIFVDIPFFTQCGCNENQGFNSLVNMVDIQGRWAYLIINAADETEAEIAYEALNVGDDGMYVINEEQSIALENYAAWKFALSYPEMYNSLQIGEWKKDYMFQANRCRGLAARRKFEQSKDQIRRKINQMVNNSLPFDMLAGMYNSFIYPTITSI